MSGFLQRLTPEALRRLRKIVKAEMIQFGIDPHFLDTREGIRQIDMQIDVYAARTAESLIERGMDSGLIERRVSNR